MDKRILKAEQWCMKNNPDAYNRKPDVAWIEDFILRTYEGDAQAEKVR